MDVPFLHKKFSIENACTEVSIRDGEAGIPVVHIKNQHASAQICLQGAHLLSWIPADEKEVIWLSEDAVFAPSKSIRGGVPICWPWFGAHSTEETWPAHGFARTAIWRLMEVDVLENGFTRIYLTLDPTPETSEMWPEGATVDCIMTIGTKLEFELITHNVGQQPITISQALHTYFNVGDIEQTVIHGLEDTDYLDKTDGFARKHQHGLVTIAQEVDRIYLNTSNDCVIHDGKQGRKIVIIKNGSHSTVVWNPWSEVAQKMGDLGTDGYRHMVCVETANAADDAVLIQPGQIHHLWVQYEVKH